MTMPSTSFCVPRLYEVGMLEVRLNSGRLLLVELLLAVREGTGRPGASIPPTVVGVTRIPAAFSLLIEFCDGDRPKKDGMKCDLFFSVSGADVDGGSACATTVVLAMTVAAASGGFREPSSSASSSERPSSMGPWSFPLRTVPTPSVYTSFRDLRIRRTLDQTHWRSSSQCWCSTSSTLCNRFVCAYYIGHRLGDETCLKLDHTCTRRVYVCRYQRHCERLNRWRE